MATEFLSPDWFVATNERLAANPPTDVRETRHVVLTLDEPPRGGVHALTITIGPNGADIVEGDFLGADAVLRLRYDDALALGNGTLDSATAVRQGRLKVRGDVGALVELAPWLQRLLPDGETLTD